MAHLPSVVLETVGDDGLRRIVRKLVDQAEAGDVAAATLLLRYLVGKPTEAPNPDRALVRELPTLPEAVMALTQKLAPASTIDMLRSSIPLMDQAVAAEIGPPPSPKALAARKAEREPIAGLQKDVLNELAKRSVKQRKKP